MKFTAKQEQKAACLVCPHRCLRIDCNNFRNNPCQKLDATCSKKWLNDLRKSKKYRKDILAICHWLYDDDLHYFKIKE
ncbi:MAG: hypothetical protein HFJ35_00205 [Clostridia bacterium]|nr:hypothetical protein [Clostridia bacterium]